MGEPVGLGIIGLGRWAEAHAAAVSRSERVRIVNCHSRSASNREMFARRWGVPAASESIEELLSDPAVEGVVVSTPNDAHALHTHMALDARKPVLVDKPLAVDVAEGVAVMRSWTRSGVPVGVAHHPRRLAGVRWARRWIESGRSGEVRLAHADFSNARGAAMRDDAWHRTARGSEAGVLIQVGIHQVENLLYLLGPAVSAGARFAHRRMGPRMPDAAVVVMTHRTGTLSTVTSSWTTPSHFRLEVLAEDGNFSFDLDHSAWTSGDVDDHGAALLSPAGESGVPGLSKGDPLVEQLEELADAARMGTEMEVDPIAGLRAVAVVEAAVRSAGGGSGDIPLEELYRSAGATEDEIAKLG